ncbi:hypothetical protein FRC02_005138 [Tulasnella sp. 418]|nr:hypothetical protein FRC02_005138 [Tulasnella sp. 418]
MDQIINKYCYWKEDQVEEFIFRTEQEIKEIENQPTFARWRAITYSTLLADHVRYQEEQQEETCKKLPKELQFLGALLTGNPLNEGEYRELEEDTRTSIPDIIDHSIRFSRMVRIDIVTANLYHCYPTGHIYQAPFMEMPDAVVPPMDKEKIVATTRLGLIRHEKLLAEAVDSRSPHSWANILKAHVLTEREISALASTPTSTNVNATTTPTPSVQPSRPQDRSSRPRSKLLQVILASPFGRIFMALSRFITSLRRKISL